MRSPREERKTPKPPVGSPPVEEYHVHPTMRMVRKTPVSELERAIRKLRAHVDAAKAPVKERPQCSGEASDKPEARDPSVDPSDAACALPSFEPSTAHDGVNFHQRLIAQELDELPDVTIAKTTVRLTRLSLGFLQRYSQNWAFRRTIVGRPVSYISLAPLERRRVQVAQKRKTSLSRSDRTKRSVRQAYDSASSTKASNSATNSSTSRNKWSVSASGSYGFGDVGWGVQAEGSLEGSAEQSRQMALENITEETQKSSREVLAETETTTTVGLQTSFEQVEEHQLVNPYADRSVLFTLHELVDEFCVHTSTNGISPCLVFDFDPISSSSEPRRLGPSMKFDDAFVSTHRQFLRTALLDDSLIELLDNELDLESQPPNTGEIAENSVRCLKYFFDDVDVFAPATAGLTWDIDASYDPLAEVVFPGGSENVSAYYDTMDIDLTDLYFLMAGVRYMYRTDRDAAIAGGLEGVEFQRRATEYVVTLYQGLAGWAGVAPDVKRKMHNTIRLTEMFRRIPAFLELAEHLVVAPLKTVGGDSGTTTQSAEGEEDGDGEQNQIPPAPLNGPRVTAAARVVNHLNCFGRYYTGEYLQFLHEWTGVAAIVELTASLEQPERSLIDFLDFGRSFVDGTAWIVPFAEVVDAQAAVDAFLADGSTMGKLSDIDTSIAVRMPSNGIHIEATPGRCLLPEIPVVSSGWPPPPTGYMGTSPWLPEPDDYS